MELLRNNWNRLKKVMKNYLPLTVIIAAALMLELTTGVMYYSSQNIIKQTMDRLVQHEMNAIYLCIRNKLEEVEVTLDNMAWIVADDLAEPDSLMMATRQLVEHNPQILGSSIPCIPNYYSEKGHWYEPYSVRREDSTIETMQLGSAEHDYTQKEFFTFPMENGACHWCEPYLDKDGAQSIVTTYSVPVRDGEGKIVAVIAADISLDWLTAIINEGKTYESTERFLVTDNYNLLVGEDCPLYRSILEPLKADDDKKGFVELKDEQGRKKQVYFTPVGGKTGWMLINVLDEGDVYKRLRMIRISLLLPLMIGLFFAGLIVYRSSRNLNRLRQVNAEKERIGGELRVASQIQQNMLPQEEIKDERIDVVGSLVPAKEVGGDLYDYFIRDDKLFFCIGDVSGKGAASAMMMAVVQTKFRDFSAHENNPARIMRNINVGCCKNNNTNMFVTLFIGILDLPTGRLRYCNAGHDVPFINGAILDVQPNLPVGVLEDFTYAMQETQITPNSTIFLYTDGLTEAMNSEHKQFGLDRVKKMQEDYAGMEPKEVLVKITETVHSFVKDAEQSDDLTMLAIRYTPQLFESTFSETLIITNDVKEVSKLSTFLKSITEKLKIEVSLARQLRLAVEEAVVNVIDYAYPIGEDGEIEVKIMSDGKSMKTIISDSGVAFDPTAKEDVDTSLSAEDRQIGGLGILLVRELMDTINYERVDGRNIVTLTKIIKE